ncbi:hypothetical protein B0T14DRAFT_204472 [Immersiella caudata]|uniref:Secreted protein n=1 Tax=Immersiella caudata TaxID=314043 RepID=A0AA39WPM2_9PEZI|nr:hypothetical protein B0T14DRAFT_204472 [Immersiella caudata]
MILVHSCFVSTAVCLFSTFPSATTWPSTHRSHPAEPRTSPAPGLPNLDLCCTTFSTSNAACALTFFPAQLSQYRFHLILRARPFALPWM